MLIIGHLTMILFADDVVKGIDVQNALLLYQQILTVLHYFMEPDVQVLHEDIKGGFHSESMPVV